MFEPLADELLVTLAELTRSRTTNDETNDAARAMLMDFCTRQGFGVARAASATASPDRRARVAWFAPTPARCAARCRRHKFEHRAHGISAGLHLMIELPRHVDEFELARAAQQQSVRLFAARGFWSQPQSAPPALVLGYGAIELEDIDDGIARLARIVRQGVRPAARLRA